MKLHPRLSRATVELVTRFETFQPKARPAAEGGWTVGYGHTRSAREGAEVSRADAEALLLYDLDMAAGAVGQALFAPVTQRQFEALTAFCFNVGVENFRRSTALASVNAGMELEAADEIERWRRAELGAGAQVVDALVRRRVAEKAHFLGLPEGFAKSPSAVLRPLAAAGGIEGQAFPASATLTTANAVQARLRELVPEPMDAATASTLDDAPSSGPVASLAPLEPEAPPFPDVDTVEQPDEAGVALHAASDVDTASLMAANDMAPPPTALAEPELDLGPPIATETAASDDPMPAASVAPQVPPAAKAGAPWDRRTAYALLTGVGACLFVIAAVLIMGGKPGLTNLGLGVVGVVLLAPGVYGLLGPTGEALPTPGSPPDAAS